MLTATIYIDRIFKFILFRISFSFLNPSNKTKQKPTARKLERFSIRWKPKSYPVYTICDRLLCKIVRFILLIFAYFSMCVKQFYGLVNMRGNQNAKRLNCFRTTRKTQETNNNNDREKKIAKSLSEFYTCISDCDTVSHRFGINKQKNK